MSRGSYSWTFEDLEIRNDATDEPKEVNVEFLLVCTQPGEAAEWEIDTIEIVFDTVKTLAVTEEQLSQLFPNGSDMINNAIESAVENGEVE